MRQYIISEERLKAFIRTSKLYGFACECVFYSPSEKELEVTEDDLKPYTEIKEHEYVPDIDEDFSNTLKKIINKLNEER